MQNGPWNLPWSADQQVPESRDGAGSGDHNQPFEFGERLTTAWYGPFTARQFARLLCLKSHIAAGHRHEEILARITAPVE